MKADAKEVFIRFLNAIQAGRIYAEDHPKFGEFTRLFHARLAEHLSDRREIVLGIVDGELAWENEIYFDLSQRLKSLIEFLHELGINRIVFRAGLGPEELAKFIVSLTRPGKKKFLEDQEGGELPGMPSIRVGRLRSRVKAAAAEDPAAARRALYGGSVDFASRSITAVLDHEEVDFLDLRFNILNIMENFMGRHQELLNLISVKEKDLVTFVHLLHVAVLAMFFSSRLGFAKDDVLDLGIAALFHDVGKLHISSEILKKEGKLLDDEFARMKDHPYLGSLILQEYGDALGILPAVVAFEHHLRYDLKGYPKVPYPRPPHVASHIVSLCDVYDALAQKRSYKTDFPPDKIHEVMLKERGALFEPALFDRFFQVMGIWPVGAIVMLSDDRVAVVREVNEQDALRPKVEIVYPKPGGEIVDLLEKRDAIQVREALNPMGKGQEYLESVFAGE
jgi:HD-GYP domain-containing protein (c-di-GMP phosphodiesterase class II)